jgi:lysophospholipase L1-like esterase
MPLETSRRSRRVRSVSAHARVAITVGAFLALPACRTDHPPPVAVRPMSPPPPVVALPTAPPETPPPPHEEPPAEACEPLDAEPPMSLSSVLDLEIPPIIEPSGEVMAPFYERLARLIRGKASDHVRIAVYGDSNMTMDLITGEMRRVLQRKYGDAGHGFIALGQPWTHYKHMDVKQRVHFGFTSYAVSTHPIGDGGYGHSGIAAESQLRGAITEVSTAPESAPVGRNVSRVDLFFLRKPKYGSFDLRIDGVVKDTIDCEGPEVSLGHYRTELPDGPHRVEVVVTGRGNVRMLGTALEREKPGVVIDSLGVGALNTRSMARELASINEPMLKLRHYDLVIFMTGANDVFEFDEVPSWLKQVIDVHREALPNVPILLVSPPDRGQHKSFEPTIAIGQQRRELAVSFKTGFWDLWTAMGGRGSMARFHQLGLSQEDHIHFNAKGGAWVGDRLLTALFRDFKAYLAEHKSAGCGDADAPSYAGADRPESPHASVSPQRLGP